MVLEFDYKKSVKFLLYIQLFVFSALGFISLLCLMGFILSKILFGIMFIISLIYIIVLLLMLNSLDKIYEEETKK